MLETILRQTVPSGDCHGKDVAVTTRLVMAPILFSVIWPVVFEPMTGKDNPAGHDEIDLNALFPLHTQYLLVALATGSQVHHD